MPDRMKRRRRGETHDHKEVALFICRYINNGSSIGRPPERWMTDIKEAADPNWCLKTRETDKWKQFGIEEKIIFKEINISIITKEEISDSQMLVRFNIIYYL